MDYSQNDGGDDTAHLYAWLGREPATGAEGIIVMPTERGALPLVFSDESRARKFKSWAQIAATERCHPAHLVAFTRRETLAVIQPRDAN